MKSYKVKRNYRCVLRLSTVGQLRLSQTNAHSNATLPSGLSYPFLRQVISLLSLVAAQSDEQHSSAAQYQTLKLVHFVDLYTPTLEDLHVCRGRRRHSATDDTLRNRYFASFASFLGSHFGVIFSRVPNRWHPILCVLDDSLRYADIRPLMKLRKLYFKEGRDSGARSNAK